MGRVCSLRKNPMRLRGTNFCTSSPCFAPSFVRQPNGPECMQIERNAPKRLLRVQWGVSVAFMGISPTRLHGTNFCTSSAHFAPSFERQPNGPECTQMVRNETTTSVLGPMGWIRCVRCKKFRRDFVTRMFSQVRPVLR